MSENFETRYFSGQGKLFFGKRGAAGEPEQLIFVGDISSAELTPNITKESVTENVTGIAGIGAEMMTKVEYNLSIQMRSVKPEHFAQALQADITKVAAGTVTGETHVAYQNTFTNLANTKVSNVVVKVGTTTMTEDTDYVLHADDGMIEILDTGSINDGDTITVDYSVAAQSILKVNPQNDDISIVFAGLNRADNNKRTRCEIYKCKLSPSSMGFISQSFGEMPVTGTVLVDTLRPAGDQYFSWKIED